MHKRGLWRRATLVIVSGFMGCRGTVFKNGSRELHLTDQFIAVTEKMTQQVSGRAEEWRARFAMLGLSGGLA